MASYKGHIAGGVALYSIIIALTLMESTGRVEFNLPSQLISLLSEIIPSNLSTLFYSLIALIFGSLAPDLDHHASKIRGVVTSVALLLLIALLVLPAMGLKTIAVNRTLIAFTVFILVLAFIPRLFKHRSAWHWIIGLIVGIWGIWVVTEQFRLTSEPLIAAYAIGYISHLLLDAF